MAAQRQKRPSDRVVFVGDGVPQRFEILIRDDLGATSSTLPARK
jgi:hypothetical protein